MHNCQYMKIIRKPHFASVRVMCTRTYNMSMAFGKICKYTSLKTRWKFLSAMLLSLTLFWLITLIIRDTEVKDCAFKDAEVNMSQSSLKDQDQSKVLDTFKRPFIIENHQLYLRTFARSHQSGKNPKTTACDKEAFRARGHKKQLIVYFNPPAWWPADFNFSRCECSHCEIMHSQNITQADIVLFYGVRLSIREPPPRPRGQIWVVIGNEAPVYYTGVLHTPRWRGVFNWTSTHRVDSDLFNPYGLLLDRNHGLRKRAFYESLANSKAKLAVAVISHCNTKSLREEYIKELQQYMHVDVYGLCGIKTSCPKKNNTCLADLVRPYIFLLAFENSLCEDYVTEKFLQTFNDDFPVVPVVRGGTDYQRYFPHGTFIDASDFNSPKELARYLIRTGNDHKKVADMLEAKSRYKRISMYHQCQVCYILHKYKISRSGIDPSVSAADKASVTKTYPDVFRWLLQDKCFHPHDFSSASRENQE